VVGKELTYAESADSEGRRRIRSKPQNAEGSFSVYIADPTAATFWGWVDNLQELVESAHENKGTITYTPPDGTQVTFDLQSIQISGMPQRGVELKNHRVEVDVTFECLPYGRLAERALNLRPGNLVRNPSFESDTSTWTKITTGWTGGTSTMSRIANTTLSSNYVMRMIGTKDATGTARTLDAQSDYIAVLPNTSYTLTASNNVIDATGTGNAVVIEWFTSVPASISTSTGTNLTGTGIKSHSLVATSPGTAAFAKVYLRSSSSTSGDTLDSYWDAVTLLPTTATATVSIPGPIGDLLVDDVPGQVPALAELTLTDGSTQTRNHVEVGVQHRYDPAKAEPIRLDAVTQVTGLAGASNTRAGSIATNVLRAGMTTTPVAVCVAEDQPHDGRWKVRARLWPDKIDTKVRLSWRAGTAPFAREKWVTIPGEDAWYEVDLGTVNIPTQPAPHVADFRIEGKSATGITTMDVDVLYFEPADNYTRLRGDTAQDVATAAVVAADDFNAHSSGALAGKTPVISTGNWSGAGDADDFGFSLVVLGLGQEVVRSAVSDAATGVQTGRLNLCGTGVVAACTVSVDLYSSAAATTRTRRWGVILRYVDINNFLVGYVEQQIIGSTWVAYAVLTKRVASVNTELSRVLLDVSGVPSDLKAALSVSADASGNANVYVGLNNAAPTLRLSVTDASLATAAALDDGMVGIWDWYTDATADQRKFNDFVAVSNAAGATVPNPAINPTRAVTLTHNTALTASSDGTLLGNTPIREGQYLKLPPETRNSYRTRVAVKARRNDGDSGFTDTGTTDALTASLNVTPRVHLTSP
jgi:hypothetical protein